MPKRKRPLAIGELSPPNRTASVTTQPLTVGELLSIQSYRLNKQPLTNGELLSIELYRLSKQPLTDGELLSI
jgi:hypothetical protein